MFFYEEVADFKYIVVSVNLFSGTGYHYSAATKTGTRLFGLFGSN